jgi:recombinational DNA repair ATPase RecF
MSGLVNMSAGGSGELMLVVNGGDAFAQRMTDLKAAKDEAQAAFDALRLGMEAQAAWDAANALKATYDAKMAAVAADIDAMRQACIDEVTLERGNAAKDCADARAEARKIRADAKLAAQKVKDDIAAELEQARLSRAAADAEFQAASAAKADALVAIEHAAGKLVEAEATKKAAEDLVAALKSVMGVEPAPATEG